MKIIIMILIIIWNINIINNVIMKVMICNEIIIMKY